MPMVPVTAGPYDLSASIGQNSAFKGQAKADQSNSLQGNISEEMKYNVDLWDGQNYSSWQDHCNNIRKYADNYQDYALKYVQAYFSLSDSEMNTLFGRTSKLEDATNGG